MPTLSHEELLSSLQAVERKNQEANWLHGLERRKILEREFHNQSRDETFVESLSTDSFAELHGNKKFYDTVDRSTDYVNNWLKAHVGDKVFLDYACGVGINTLNASTFGAALSIGIDISDVSIAKAKRAAAQRGLSERAFFLEGDCENTGLPGDSIDVILCCGMLHHLDLQFAFPEMRRILRPGGRILAVEALGYNPFIQLYRNLTPQMRTDWEKRHILSLKDVRFAEKFFRVGAIHYWHMFAPAAAYVRQPGIRRYALAVLNSVDALLTRIPMIQRWAWQFTFELIKDER